MVDPFPLAPALWTATAPPAPPLETSIAFRWCGRVAITRDFLPHLHAPAPGLLVDIGCMGRGIALQTAIGQAMAEYVATGDEGALPLPLTPVRPLPFYGLHNAVAAAFIAWYRFLDRRGMA